MVFEFLNNININEEILDENIPRDLLQAYKRSSAYDSQRNPESSHSELGRDSQRRFVKYDYGKSSYDAISAEEATSLVKRDKHNIQKLRIIYDGNLVEYEVRDNGSIYAIYGDTSSNVTIGEKTYKNVRYVPWKKLLEIADKIYITDEYEHPLFNDEATRDRRNNNDKLSFLGSVASKDTPGYDEHKPYDNFMLNKRPAYGELDTGAHALGQRFKLGQIRTNLSSNNQIKGKFEEYIELLELKKKHYDAYTRARKALKKLFRDRDDYDDEEFSVLTSRFESKLKVALDTYNETAKKVNNLKGIVINGCKAESSDLLQKAAIYLKEVQDALAKGFALKKRIEDLHITNVEKDITKNWDHNRVKTKVNSLLKALAEAELKLQGMIDDGAERISIDATSQDIADKKVELESKLQELERIKKELVKAHLAELKSAEDELDQVDVRLAQLRPKDAARKAERAAKNKAPELDPALVDIIDFVDFSSETTEE